MLELLLFYLIFADKIKDKISIIQRNMNNSKEIDVRVYYHNLSKSERSKLLGYLFKHFDLKINTMSSKLSEKAPNKLRPIEEKVIRDVISEGIWVQ